MATVQQCGRKGVETGTQLKLGPNLLPASVSLESGGWGTCFVRSPLSCVPFPLAMVLSNELWSTKPRSCQSGMNQLFERLA